MSTRVNLADPTIEPSDEEIQEISREAFAGLPAQRRESLARLRAQVAALRVDALALASTLAGGTPREPS